MHFISFFILLAQKNTVKVRNVHDVIDSVYCNYIRNITWFGTWMAGSTAFFCTIFILETFRMLKTLKYACCMMKNYTQKWALRQFYDMQTYPIHDA